MIPNAVVDCARIGRVVRINSSEKRKSATPSTEG